MDYKTYIIDEITKHPNIQPNDIVKLCYQATYGAEHLISNIDNAKKYLIEEYNYIEKKNGNLIDNISDDICRVNLSVWKYYSLPIEWLFKMFIYSPKKDINKDLLINNLNNVSQIIKDFKLNFSFDEWTKYYDNYKKIGMPPVHHSETYRNCYKPSYRIINRKYTKIIDILINIVKYTNNKPFVIAIDGKAGAGKTTISKLLSNIIDAEIINLDDFFLPLELRTKDRLEEIGGNIHYERFKEEVIDNIKKGAFKYNVFDCSIMNYKGLKEINNNSFIIVEGSYSLHPIFNKYYDLSIFLDIEYDEQIKRIEDRNKELLNKFIKTWIPMEERYFKHFKIQEKAMMIL